MCTTLKNAEIVIKNVLITSNSLYEGYNADNSPSEKDEEDDSIPQELDEEDVDGCLNERILSIEHTYCKRKICN
ncbi:hypothetical protein ACI65C_012122 [Semiaphis heraclei]